MVTALGIMRCCKGLSKGLFLLQLLTALQVGSTVVVTLTAHFADEKREAWGRQRLIHDLTAG